MEGESCCAASLLVVDDDPGTRLAMMALLEPLAFRVVLASSGEQAIELAKGERFAVILVDVRMPHLDGFETVARLREEAQSKTTPIILLSAFGSGGEYARKAYAVGAVDYITKPVDTDLLRAKVASLVALWSSESNRPREETSDRAVAAYFRAERQNLLKDRLVGILGHDLRDPLASITMNTQAILTCGELPERVTVMAVRIARSARRMKELVGKMLDFTCSELGRGVSLSPQPVNMGELCRAIVEDAESAHPRRSMRLDCVGDLGGVWDPVRTTQAISNLVGNAIKHSATDVVIQADGSDQALVRVSVHNGGEPIPNHELPKLFEPFRQGTTAGSGEGLGLGLYIVQEIVSAHGGCIEARSSAAEGTSFLTVWPRTPASGRQD